LCGEESVHLWHSAQRLDHRVTDEMSERNLTAATASQMIINDGAIVDH
jgi:hypothetical protein